MPAVDLTQTSTWDLPIERPLRVDPANHPWDDSADLVVVGVGGAGVAASLEALEKGISVIALDQYGLGGSTVANGGVFYAGGGTAIQRAAGEADTPEEMFKYLKLEVGRVVEEETLRRFCNESVETVDWLLAHGARLDSTVCKDKTSYPPLDRFLYHSDSSLAAPYARHAVPAARGHRGYTQNGNKAWGLGGAIYDPLLASAIQRGLRLQIQAEARQLAVDAGGAVVGVKALVMPAQAAATRAHARCIKAAAAWLGALPPSFPLAGLTQWVGRRYLAKARRLETQRVPRWYRAHRGVVLSTGGFVMNRRMIEQLAPKYRQGMPLGTLGDTGSGIALGVGAGGAFDLADRISAWRFINPPLAWARGALVNARGARFVNEMLYGASIGDAMVERNGGKAWIVLDARLIAESRRQARDPKTVGFQRDVAMVNLWMNAKKAPTLDALADRMGFDRDILQATIEAYNQAARGEIADPFEKRQGECAEIAQGPFYAIDASIDSRWLPLPTMTVGGLRVDEKRGLVRRPDGSLIPGLYAAGRSAVGICSNIYVSGLSYADCIFSGRRAARDAAAAGPEKISLS